MDTFTDDPLYDYNFSGDYCDNCTCSSSYLQGSDTFIPVLYFLIFFTGFLGNLFVIVVVQSKGRTSGRLVDTFIINLAVADLVFVLTLPLWAVSAGRGGQWDFGPAGDPLCKLSSYIIAVNRFSNIAFLTCMSVDRYLAVVKLMDSRYLRSSRCISATCAVVWMVSLLLGVPSLLYRGVQISYEEVFCVEDTRSTFFLGLSLTMTLFTFLFPLSVIVFCYGTIIQHLNRHCGVAVNPRAEARRRHSLKMVLSIIVAFVLSWLPFNIFKVIMISSQLSNLLLSCEALAWQRTGLLLSCCLAFLNSCINPVIYFFLDHHFRRHAEILCRSCMGKPKSQQNINSSASLTNMGTSENSGRTQLHTID